MDLNDAFSKYSVFIDKEKGPGSSIEPSVNEISAFYPVFEMLNGSRVEIYLEHGTSGALTAAVTEEIRKLNQRIKSRKEGRTDDAINIIAYDGKNLETLLKRAGNNDGVRRIFVNNSKMNEAFESLIKTNAELLKGNRLITAELPDAKDGVSKSVHQAWLIKFALLSALVEQENMSTVGAALEQELELSETAAGDGINTNEFIGRLTESGKPDEGIDAIKGRAEYFLGNVVRLSQLIATQLRILKAFWTAA